VIIAKGVGEKEVSVCENNEEKRSKRSESKPI
jgi:hypothetical protein